jgi:HEAT repeat protein
MNGRPAPPHALAQIRPAARNGRVAPFRLSAFCLSTLLLVSASAGQTFARPSSQKTQPQTLRSTRQNQNALTPVQREIEKQRTRLASSDAEERRDAVTRLGAMQRPDASRAAAQSLADAAPIIRATAARAVLSLPPEEAARLLLPLLQDKQEFVRREAAYALGLTRSASAVEALAAALARDKEAGVRGAAAVALGQIADARAVPFLSEALGRRIRRSGFLNRVTFRRTEENDLVRRAAAVSLGQIGAREGVPALITALQNERAGDDVRREAARALGLIGDARAVPALRSALTARDPYLSQIALEALKKLEPAATRPA